MSHWHYVKKHNLPFFIPFSLIASIILTVTIMNWQNEIRFYFMAGFCIFLLLIVIIDMFTNRYVEKTLTLISCDKIQENIYNCVFFDNESNKAMRFIYTDNPCQILEINKNYVVVTHGKHVFKLLRPAENQTIQGFQASHQAAISELNVVEEQLRIKNEQRMFALDEGSQKFYKVAKIVQGTIALMVGLPLVYMGLTGRVHPKEFVPIFLIFSSAFVLLGINAISQGLKK